MSGPPKMDMWTDGTCVPNPGRGACAALLIANMDGADHFKFYLKHAGLAPTYDTLREATKGFVDWSGNPKRDRVDRVDHPRFPIEKPRGKDTDLPIPKGMDRQDALEWLLELEEISAIKIFGNTQKVISRMRKEKDEIEM